MTAPRPRTMLAARAFCALLFVGAGLLHFLYPRPYVKIVPDALPYPEALVAISGAAEMLAGAALLVPGLRKPAAFGLIFLLVAVFPANVNMAINREQIAPQAPEWALWARLPLQPLLIWLVWFVRKDRAAA